MDSSITTTISFAYENEGVQLNFALTTNEQKEKFVSILEKAIEDVKNSITK